MVEEENLSKRLFLAAIEVADDPRDINLIIS
jgi:hypothetical protein